jgi:glycosyltransferase involved in cell wall biosynthesis
MDKKTTTLLFDASPMIGKKSGIGHFTERLLVALCEEKGTHIIVFYFDFLGRNKPTLPTHPSITYKPVKYVPSKALNVLRRFGIQIPVEFLLGYFKYDLAVFTNYVHYPSIFKKPFAVAVHDLGIYDCPEYVSEANLKYMRRFIPRSIKAASIIITISEFSKSRLKHYFGDGVIDKTILMPIPYIHSHTVSKSISKNISGIIKSKYILFVGTIEPRKNISNLIKAYSKLDQKTKREYKLVLAGNWGWRTEEIQKTLDANSSESIIITGYVTDYERDKLYENADLVVMVSHYEGFGMPILEAAHHKSKILLSNIPVFHEVAGESAFYCNHDDVKDISENIKYSLKSKSKKPIQSNYSWSKNGKNLLNKIRELL